MFTDRLQEINQRVGGVLLSAVVGRDGLVVESAGRLEGGDIEALAAEVTTQLGAIAQSHLGLGGGEVEQFSVTTESYSLLVGSLTDDYYLLLVVDREGGDGRARFELRRARLRLGPDLA